MYVQGGKSEILTSFTTVRRQVTLTKYTFSGRRSTVLKRSRGYGGGNYLEMAQFLKPSPTLRASVFPGRHWYRFLLQYLTKVVSIRWPLMYETLLRSDEYVVGMWGVWGVWRVWRVCSGGVSFWRSLWSCGGIVLGVWPAVMVLGMCCTTWRRHIWNGRASP